MKAESWMMKEAVVCERSSFMERLTILFWSWLYDVGFRDG